MGAKWFGGACLLAIGAVGAVRSVSTERKRLDVLDAWIELIAYLCAGIDRSLTPLDELLQHADRRILARITPKGTRDLPTLLAASEALLDTQSQRAIRSLLCELGNGYRADQIRQCDECLATLKQARKTVERELPSRIRLCITLALCIPLGAVILLW